MTKIPISFKNLYSSKYSQTKSIKRLFFIPTKWPRHWIFRTCKEKKKLNQSGFILLNSATL